MSGLRLVFELWFKWRDCVIAEQLRNKQFGGDDAKTDFSQDLSRRLLQVPSFDTAACVLYRKTHGDFINAPLL